MIFWLKNRFFIQIIYRFTFFVSQSILVSLIFVHFSSFSQLFIPTIIITNRQLLHLPNLIPTHFYHISQFIHYCKQNNSQQYKLEKPEKSLISSSTSFPAMKTVLTGKPGPNAGSFTYLWNFHSPLSTIPNPNSPKT